MTSTPLKPGEFRGVCKRPVQWVHRALLEVPPEEGGRTREVRGEKLYPIYCTGISTSDRAVFEKHCKDEHGTAARGAWKMDGPRIPIPVRLRPAKPRSGGQGKPFVSKADTRTCETCTLVAEDDGTYEMDLWWKEHTTGCALLQDLI